MSENPCPPVVINRLNKTFRGKRGKTVAALQDVSLNIDRGEVFGFLGPNGAGKSTTIKALMGMIRPGSGEIRLCGQPAGTVASRQKVGYLPENPAFYDFLSAREYMQFVADSYGMTRAAAKSAIDIWLDRLALTAAAKRPIRTYSKGMVQRLGLAQALFHDPDVAILDEPMSGLDPQGRALVKDLITELKQAGKTVFFSTHITADVEKACDRLAIIVGGRIRVDSPVEEIMRQGVTGYRILARSERLAALTDGECVAAALQEYEFRVDTSSLSQKIAGITATGASIELVEPLRRDLETYFLDVVQQARA